MNSNLSTTLQIWIGGIISGMAMAAISVILSYVAKRLRVIDGQLPVMRAKTVSWYLYAIMVSQGFIKSVIFNEDRCRKFFNDIFLSIFAVIH